ncbi:MAG: MarR family transcriptional regulator [Rhodospirillaceae bacterium]|nr:MarR family transcriptional regulator [Rhodospirillaceae bacterium]
MAGSAIAAIAPAGDRETGVTKDDRLDLRVWFRLLTCATHIERSVRQGLREEFGITLPRFDLLAQLDRAKDGLTMGELSRRLMVTNGNVTGLIDRLVTEGLVARQPSLHDRRAQVVRLTPTGQQAFDAMIPMHQAFIASRFEGLSRSELSELHRLLGKLKTAFEARESKSVTEKKEETP